MMKQYYGWWVYEWVKDTATERRKYASSLLNKTLDYDNNFDPWDYPDNGLKDWFYRYDGD